MTIDPKSETKNLARPVLQLGNPLLRQISQAVTKTNDKSFKNEIAELHARLDLFREEYGFGRAVAAPQIGIQKRFIAAKLNGKRHTLINPEISWSSPEQFSMWDDCMCFPSLLVRVLRNNSVSVRFVDETGESQFWSELPQDIAELLQHEIDHLDGILAIDRAVDRDSLITRSTFDSMREYFANQVDYVIS